MQKRRECLIVFTTTYKTSEKSRFCTFWTKKTLRKCPRSQKRTNLLELEIGGGNVSRAQFEKCCAFSARTRIPRSDDYMFWTKNFIRFKTRRKVLWSDIDTKRIYVVWKIMTLICSTVLFIENHINETHWDIKIHK